MNQKREREGFISFWENPDVQVLQSEDNSVVNKFRENLFGKAPYEFLSSGDPVPTHLPDRKKPIVILSETYRQKYPAPNSYNYGEGDYIDLVGREYKIGKGSFADNQKDYERVNSAFEEPTLQKDENIGNVLMYICLPRNSIIEAPKIDEEIAIIHIKTRVVCVGVIEECYFGPRHLTGHAFLKNFVSLGKQSQFIDNSLFNHVLDKSSIYYKSIRKNAIK